MGKTLMSKLGHRQLPEGFPSHVWVPVHLCQPLQAMTTLFCTTFDFMVLSLPVACARCMCPQTPWLSILVLEHATGSLYGAKGYLLLLASPRAV